MQAQPSTTTVNVQPLRLATPLEDHLEAAGLLVKREDLSCPEPGPPFSKTRGVMAHMAKRYAEGVRLFGALDTYHSQAGHAVSWAARFLGAQCINYFPVYAREQVLGHERFWPKQLRAPQLRSQELGAELVGLKAGRSAVLYHQAKRDCVSRGGYMMPNALKLPEMVEETAAEVVRTFEHASRAEFQLLRSSPWLIACSSATIAAGVIAGLHDTGAFKSGARVILHMGYSRSEEAVRAYLMKCYTAARGAWPVERTNIIAEYVDEGYAYKDVARPGPTPPWPCNEHYDLKALRWWLREGQPRYERAVLWNIG